MADLHIVLDLGGQYVRAVSTKENYVVNELNVVALDEETKQIKASGNAAYKLAENAMSNIVLTRPIKEGTVVDPVGATHLLNNLLTKISPVRSLSQMVVHCVLPVGVNKKDKTLIESILNQVGVRQTYFLNMPHADCVKLLTEFDAACGIICDIGSDTVEIATVFGDEIINACTLFYGSRQIDREIVQLLIDKYELKISLQDAEEVKIQCGSLYPNDNSVCIVEGVNTQKGVREEITISAREMYNTLSAVARKYTQVVESMLATFDENRVKQLRNDGVFLCGGGALLSGIDRYFVDVLKINTRIAAHPQEVTVKGAQILVKRQLLHDGR